MQTFGFICPDILVILFRLSPVHASNNHKKSFEVDLRLDFFLISANPYNTSDFSYFSPPYFRRWGTKQTHPISSTFKKDHTFPSSLFPFPGALRNPILHHVPWSRLHLLQILQLPSFLFYGACGWTLTFGLLSTSDHSLRFVASQRSLLWIPVHITDSFLRDLVVFTSESPPSPLTFPYSHRCKRAVAIAKRLDERHLFSILT